MQYLIKFAVTSQHIRSHWARFGPSKRARTSHASFYRVRAEVICLAPAHCPVQNGCRYNSLYPHKRLHVIYHDLSG